jgi:hypothetical protein
MGLGLQGMKAVLAPLARPIPTGTHRVLGAETTNHIHY